ncbi:hypothetical protein LCGC14_1152190 [marine sediment metagenome]|uniref:Uncharacterized protein n=1 Tax=marine sediment metagenome TaxID=412755 RepID=A0A0F9MIC3_9ZZZZ
MSSVYPRAVQKADVTPLDQAECAQDIIAARGGNPEASKAQLVGGILAGNDDVAGFERTWAAVEEERVAMAAVSPADYDTRVEYEAELDKVAVHLDSMTWAGSVILKEGASTWNELQDKLSPVEV